MSMRLTPADQMLYDEHRTRPAQMQVVGFTRQQIELLEKDFPEVLDGSLSDAEVRHRVGQRSVLAYIRSRLT